MGTKFIELQVKAFIDQDGKKWEHVKVKTAESDLTILKARAENAWLCEDGRLITGSLYSGGETGSGYNGPTANTKDNPKVYGQNGEYSTWYEIVKE